MVARSHREADRSEVGIADAHEDDVVVWRHDEQVVHRNVVGQEPDAGCGPTRRRPRGRQTRHRLHERARVGDLGLESAVDEVDPPRTPARRIGGAQPEHRELGRVGRAEQPLLGHGRRQRRGDAREPIHCDGRCDADLRSFGQHTVELVEEVVPAGFLQLGSQRREAVDQHEQAGRTRAARPAVTPSLELMAEHPDEPFHALPIAGRDDGAGVRETGERRKRAPSEIGDQEVGLVGRPPTGDVERQCRQRRGRATAAAAAQQDVP